MNGMIVFDIILMAAVFVIAIWAGNRLYASVGLDAHKQIEMEKTVTNS